MQVLGEASGYHNELDFIPSSVQYPSKNAL